MHAGFLAVACNSDQGLNSGLLHWEHSLGHLTIREVLSVPTSYPGGHFKVTCEDLIKKHRSPETSLEFSSM